MDKGTEQINFLPLPVQIPIRHRDADKPWVAPIAQGLIIENAPPRRLIRHGEDVVGQYPLDSVVEERFMLLRMVELRWITALDLAAHWGLHRNTLGNWAWRYQHFGLDGLVPGRLPSKKERLQEVLQIAQAVVLRRGRRVSAAEVGREIEAAGLGRLPRSTLAHLRLTLLLPRQPSIWDGQPAPDDESAQDGTGAAEGSAPAGEVVEERLGSMEGGAEQPEAPDGDTAEEGKQSCRTVGVEQPPAPAAGDVRMQHAGLALVLPQAQALLEPLQGFLEEQWGRRAWYYRPGQLLLAFLLYVLSGYANPEQVKAAPAPDFGPLLGRRRAPACITLRRRLPPLADTAVLVEELQRRIAQRYLELGWVVADPGAWLLDGHFAPYHGEQPWGKAWWPQRRLAYPGRLAEWIHDLRGRPLFLRVTQGFELFADQIPLVADGMKALLSAAGRTDPFLLVFDRGGYSAEVFRSLNARGVGWVTWLRSKVDLPPEAFTTEAALPPAGPGHLRVVHYACFTHRVPGCHDDVAAVAWHDGDPAHQVALLHNTDRCQPGRWEPRQLIAMLEGRWAQENAFKGMKAAVDIDWTNGYLHVPSADTPVPNPQVRRLRARLATRVEQLRRAMDRPVPCRPAAAARLRRRIGTLQAQVTRLTGRLRQLPATVSYGTLGRPATRQLDPGRGLLFPVLRAAAYHLRLQLRDRIAAVFPDHREHDKVLRVLLATPGRYAQTETADWIILRRPALPRYADALAACIAAIDAEPPHSPNRPALPLRLALED